MSKPNETPTADLLVLVPAAGDPGRLVQSGVCGARPPTATWTDSCGWVEGGHPGQFWTTGLVLWCDGLVHEGFDRAVQASGPFGWPCPAPWKRTCADAVWLAQLLVNLGLVQRVVRLRRVEGFQPGVLGNLVECADPCECGARCSHADVEAEPCWGAVQLLDLNPDDAGLGPVPLDLHPRFAHACDGHRPVYVPPDGVYQPVPR